MMHRSVRGRRLGPSGIACGVMLVVLTVGSGHRVRAESVVGTAAETRVGTTIDPSVERNPAVGDSSLDAIDLSDVADSLSQLIQVPTVWPRPELTAGSSASANGDGRRERQREAAANIERAISVLETRYPRVFDVLDARRVAGHSLLLEWPGSEPASKPIMLLTHLDVVPVESATVADWTYPPYAGQLAAGQVWGRGAIDNKSSIVSIMHAIRHLIALDFQPRRTVYIGVSHDEEVGGAMGARGISNVLRDAGTELEFTLNEGLAVTDGLIKGVESPVAMIGLAERGYFSVRLTARATGGHSSIGGEDNAINRVAEALHRLAQQPMDAVLTAPTLDMLTTLAPSMGTLGRFVLSRPDLFGALIKRQLLGSVETRSLVQTSITPTMLNAGVKENVVARVATAVVNVRPIPGNSVEACIEHIQRVTEGLGISATIIAEATGASPVSRSDVAAYRAVESAIGAIFPDALIAPGLAVAATESRFYSDLTQANFRFMPYRLDKSNVRSIHGVDERMDIDNLHEMVKFFVTLLHAA